MITPASQNDLPEIMTLIQAVIVEMNSNNIDQWDEIYPDKADIENDIRSHSLYKYENDGTVAAIITINNQGSPEYDVIPCIVAHRLAVLPMYQGKGIAKKLMQFCEEIALQNSNTSIRLECICE